MHLFLSFCWFLLVLGFFLFLSCLTIILAWLLGPAISGIDFSFQFSLKDFFKCLLWSWQNGYKFLSSVFIVESFYFPPYFSPDSLAGYNNLSFYPLGLEKHHSKPFWLLESQLNGRWLFWWQTFVWDLAFLAIFLCSVYLLSLLK